MTGAASDYRLVRVLQERVADQMTREKHAREQQGLPPLAAADERQLAMSRAADVVARHMQSQLAAGVDLPDPGVDRRLVEAIDAAMYGAGALQELLDDGDIENIDINGCDEVWITYADHRGKVRGRPVAASDEDLIDVVRTLGSYAGLNARPFTPAHPELDLRLPDGSRLSAVMAASERPLVSVRRNRFPQMFLAEVPAAARRPGRGGAPQTLLELGTVDARLAAFLQAAVRARCNIVVAGATDAGKTTLLRALINCIPPGERLITVERALELGLRMHPELHWDVAEMEEVLPSADGGGGLSIGQLVRRTRRQNPSRVIVGEVLGPEVVEMLSAMSQGNDGSLSTIHARDAADVFQRLATYAAQYEGMPFEVTHALMGSALDLIVFVRKNPRLGGRRTVTEVLEVTGAVEGRVARSRIFTESAEDGRAVRDSEVQLARWRLLADAGYDDAAHERSTVEGLAWGRSR
ncbi:MAG: CpaF family protein [Kineosporiaceae bacterium]|nr:CpaF family protein [Kineosporiaceae bacterium]